MDTIVRACLDKRLPKELQEFAKQESVRVNPANAGRRGRLELAAETRYLWKPGMVLPVRFLGGDPVVAQKVEFYAHQWEQYANIKFQFVASGPAPVRVSFMPGGSWSWVGTEALAHSDQSVPTMNFGWLTPTTDDADVGAVVLHEFGHALGCIHEHQNPTNGIPWNLEKAYAYYQRQGWTREEVDFQVFRKYSELQTQFTQFDPLSIMEYPVPADITVGGFCVGFNTQLSDTDKAFIGKLYPF